MAEAEQQAVGPVIPEVPLSDFAPSITVIEGRRKFEVAVNAAANRASWQITTSKLRSMLDKRINELEKSEVIPDEKALKKLAETAALIQDMSIRGYEGGKKVSEKDSSDFERFAIGAVKAATEGAVKGMTSFKEREEKIKALGKRKEEKQVIEMAPAVAVSQ